MAASHFSVVKYNSLPLIADADAQFNNQLASAGITRDEFFSELAPLFFGEEKGSKYSAFLVHRHYLLKDGECMVTANNITRPTTEKSPNIIPESWLSTGEESEFRFTTDLTSVPPPPSAEFLSKFQAIVDKHGIDTLGVCYAPAVGELAPGYFFLESNGPGDREQVITIVPESSTLNSPTTVPAAWVAKDGPSGLTMVKDCSCDHLPPCGIVGCQCGCRSSNVAPCLCNHHGSQDCK